MGPGEEPPGAQGAPAPKARRFPDMTEGQFLFRENRIVEIFEMVYQNLTQGLFSEATDLLERAMEIDFEHPGVASALKCAAFWKERQEKERSITDTYERGEFYLSQWKSFQAFAGRLGDVPERCTGAIRHYVFSAALKQYLQLLDGEPGVDAEVLLRIGRCFKGTGNYEQAVEFLEQAHRDGRENAEVLAELADCYSLVSETRASKVFFREAFFLDPGAVDLSTLESPMIQRLADKVRALGVPEQEVSEWVPVYGTLWGVFNVKREMKPLELGRLKQSIFLLEKEIEGGAAAPGVRPRLINRYFWLVDHYLSAGESRERIEEVLSRIRQIDPQVHRQYAT